MMALVLMAALSQSPGYDPNFDPMVGKDSAFHFVAAGGISGLSYLGASLFTQDRRIRAAAAILIPLTVSIITAVRAHDEIPGRVVAWGIPGAVFGAVFSLGIDWELHTPRTRSDCTEIGKDSDGAHILYCRDGLP